MTAKKNEPLKIPNPQIGPPAVSEVTRFKPVKVPVPREKLAGHLKEYVKLAKDLGAADAQIIRGKDIPQDIRAHYLCYFPRCRWLNSNTLCPEDLNIPWEEATEMVRSYEYAIAYKVLPPGKDITADIGSVKLDVYYTLGGGKAPNEETLVADVIRLRRLAEMSRRIQQAAYYDGYLLAMPVSVGPCRVTWCSDTKCTGKEEDGFCKYPTITAPVGSAALYIDYHSLGNMMRWGQMQPGGNCAFPESVPDFPGYYNIGLNFII